MAVSLLLKEIPGRLTKPTEERPGALLKRAIARATLPGKVRWRRAKGFGDQKSWLSGNRPGAASIAPVYDYCIS